MLHILWLILKFILIVLGIVLGLFLLAVLLVLFCPVRYKVSAVKTEDDWKQIEGEGVVSWLFHGISLSARWQEQKMEFSFHLFGIPISKLLKKRRAKKEAAQEKPRQRNAKKEKQTELAEKAEQKIETATEAHSESEECGQSSEQGDSGKQTSVQQEEKKETDVPKPTVEEIDRPKTDELVSEETVQTESSKTDSVEASSQKQFFIKKIYNKIRRLIKSIQAKLRRIRRTFDKIRSQTSWWRAFLIHPRVKAAKDLVWKHAKFLLKHIFPTRIEGQITFSFEDPALTGTALAVLGMTIPFHKNCVQINPRFDGENYLQGNIRAKGRIYGFVFVRAALIIYFDKNIKYVIKRWKTRRA